MTQARRRSGFFSRGALLLTAAVLALWAPWAHGRTIVLSGHDWDRVGCIDEIGRRQSLACYRYDTGVYANSTLMLAPGRALLFHFPLEQIPAGHRVVHAELIVPVAAMYGPEARFYLWRMLTPWGPGVCYDFRQTVPEKLPWNKPGGRGSATDRALRPSDVPQPPVAAPIIINVTEDVELWASGTAPNEGWMITVEDPGTSVQFESPLWAGPASWRLRVTYEPNEEKP